MQLGSKARKTGCSAKQETQAHYPRLGAGRWPRIEMKREPSIYSSIHPAGGVALSCPLVVRSDHFRALCLSGCLEKSRSLRRSLLNELATAKIGSGVGFNCPLAAVSIVAASTCPVVPAAFPSLPLRGGRQTPEGPESEAPPGKWTNATQPKAESARLTRTQLQSFR